MNMHKENIYTKCGFSQPSSRLAVCIIYVVPTMSPLLVCVVAGGRILGGSNESRCCWRVFCASSFASVSLHWRSNNDWIFKQLVRLLCSFGLSIGGMQNNMSKLHFLTICFLRDDNFDNLFFKLDSWNHVLSWIDAPWEAIVPGARWQHRSWTRGRGIRYLLAATI